MLEGKVSMSKSTRSTLGPGHSVSVEKPTTTPKQEFSHNSAVLSPLVSVRPTSGLHLHTQRRRWQTAAVKPARGVFPPFPAHCRGLLVTAESALSCRSSAASFSPLKHLQKSSPRPAVMNKGALPLVPWALFPGCYTECVLLAKPVMDVGLPLSLCPPDKEGISLH